MKRIAAPLALTLLALSSLSASANYGMSSYYFVDEDRPWHVGGNYRQVGTADFESKRRGHVKYADAHAALFYTHSFNTDNALSVEGGYDYMKFDWEKNPRFHNKDFNYTSLSLGYITTGLERWRWVTNAGFSVDTDGFNFGHTAVYHAMLWGRYHFADHCGVHIGAMGWYGVENGRALPIVGFDWHFSEEWHMHTIYPLSFQLLYEFADNWCVDVDYDSFGGPYRYPRRATHGKNGYPDPIFEVYAPGVALNVRYQLAHILRAHLGIGWNLGGWILIKDHNNHHGHYYHYKGAPYAEASLGMTF